jgi:IclR family KDG regulon transcriptional repressor
VPLVGLCHVRYSFEMSNSEPASEAVPSSPGSVQPASGAVQSVDRAVTILEIIARTGQAGITEIAGELEVHKSTASRIVSTLEARGLVEQDQHRGKYRLGLSILRLAGATTARLDIVQEARPIAKMLAEETGETINVAVLSDGAALYLDQAASTASVQSHNWVGQRIPLHATSNGKVLLSGLSEDSIRSTLAAKLPRFTPHTVTSIPQLLTQVAEVAATGSSLVIDELEVGLTAVSAPVRNAHGDVIASISASGPSFRFTEVKVRSARELLMSAAADISARLGWREH